MFLFCLLLGIFLTLAAANPLRPTASVTSSASPASVVTSHFPAPTAAPVVERCEEEYCSYGGEATTLQADVVTSTILSTTSVPCYITTYITNSETITETIYSTETITSTVTKEGTVFIIQYSPTPVLMSAPVTQVTEIQITNTWWSYWMTTEGSAYQVTSKGGEQTYGGNDGCDDCHKTYDDGGWGSKGSGGGWDSGAGSASAWTHINGNGNNVVSPATSVATGGGVSVGPNNGWGNSGSGSVVAGNGVTGGMVNWRSGSRTVDAADEVKSVTVVIAISLVLYTWETTDFIF
ncbi:hypothetical protein I317_01206 [Kwoniella heveanensis CBS 569]|nr:hypothetical protein I317_01206 [Kwoniella heveanensis CBS 569]